ncbi:MAG: hypothetical protein ACE5J7_04590 [Candidatus Aenigmatarchaeota archaeon]
MGCDECKGNNAIYVTVKKDGETSETPICPYVMKKGEEYDKGRGEKVVYDAGSMILCSFECLLGNGNSRTAKNFEEFREAVEASRTAET